MKKLNSFNTVKIQYRNCITFFGFQLLFAVVETVAICMKYFACSIISYDMEANSRDMI